MCIDRLISVIISVPLNDCSCIANLLNAFPCAPLSPDAPLAVRPLCTVADVNCEGT